MKILPKKIFSLFIPLNLIKEHLKNGNVRLNLSYQGCAKNGICYRPQTKIYDIFEKFGKFSIIAFEKEQNPVDLDAEKEKLETRLQPYFEKLQDGDHSKRSPDNTKGYADLNNTWTRNEAVVRDIVRLTMEK